MPTPSSRRPVRIDRLRPSLVRFSFGINLTSVDCFHRVLSRGTASEAAEESYGLLGA
jgi:hypothetical protein